jgi:hypothetical protein
VAVDPQVIADDPHREPVLTDQQFMSYVALGRAVGRRAVQRLDTPTAIADRPAIDAPAATG